MAITRDFDNKLLKRREMIVSVQAEKNPSMSEALDIVSSEGKSEKDLVAIRSIRNSFGTDNFEIEAFVYQTKDLKARYEPKPKVKKGGSN